MSEPRTPRRGAGKKPTGRRTGAPKPTEQKAAPKRGTEKRGTAKKTAATPPARKSLAQRATEERAAKRKADGPRGTTGRRGAKKPAPRRTTRPTGVRQTPPRRTSAPGAAPAVHDPDGVRLQRVLAAAGLGSRRACELLIEEGRVEVDGAVVVDQGLRVDPQRAVIHVDGLRIATAPDHVYLLVNKPAGVVSTMSDPQGRPTLAEFTADREARLFHVGRLDADTEGLILLTNDGDLAHRLSHPSFGVVKTYLAEVTGPVARDVGKRLKAGIELEDGPVRVDSFRLVSTTGSRVMVEVSLHEGRKHIVRRLLTEVGHPVTRLVRTDIGPVSLGHLKPGKQRKLSQQEIGALYRSVGL